MAVAWRMVLAWSCTGRATTISDLAPISMTHITNYVILGHLAKDEGLQLYA